ncbi:MAG: MMPL family transporter [Archaeoglobaceae archaeon]|nr:MMPL family transporter [Archaeoglobaceae archaeon]
MKSEDVLNNDVLNYVNNVVKEVKRINYISDVKFLPISKSLALIKISVNTREDAKLEEVAKQIESILNFIPKPVDLTVQKSGTVFLWYEIKRAMGKSLGIMMSISILLMVLILFLTFKGVVSKKAFAFLPLLVSILSVVYVFGLMPIFGIPMTELTHGALPILIGLCVDYAVQFQSRYEEEKWRGIEEAIKIARKNTGLAIFLSMLTSVLCFTSMSFSGVPGLGYFGFLLSLGLIIAFLLTLFVLPSILVVFDSKKVVSKRIGWIETILNKIATYSINKDKIIMLVAILLILSGSLLSTKIGMEIQHRRYAPQDLEAIRLFNELERLTGGQSVYAVVLNNEFEKLEGVKEYLERKFKIESIETSGSLVAIRISTKLESYEDYLNTYNEILKDLRFLDVKNYYVTGSPVLDMEIGKLMIEGQSRITMICYALIFILLITIYRSIKKALTPLIPIMTVIGAISVLMFSLNIKHTMMSITLNSIIIGLGIDYSIHIIERFYEERKQKSAIESLKNSTEKVGRAITVSALTTAGGFFSLMFSSFPIAKNSGFLATTAIILCLVSALTVVPAFLMVAERFKGFKILKSKAC